MGRGNMELCLNVITRTERLTTPPITSTSIVVCLAIVDVVNYDKSVEVSVRIVRWHKSEETHKFTFGHNYLSLITSVVGHHWLKI